MVINDVTRQHVMYRRCRDVTFTAHKRSLGQGNVFTSVCLFMGGVYDITFCLSARSHVLSAGV